MFVPECKSVDDFLSATDALGSFDPNFIPSHKIPVEISHPETYAHALRITEIFEEIYEGTYPYEEMLDPNHILDLIRDPNYMVWTFTSEATIIGCMMAKIDNHRKLYIRSLGVLKDYQPLVNVRPLTHYMMKTVLTKFRRDHNISYCEARTAQSIAVQIFCQDYGCHTGAIFPNKDYFLDEKESDVMMVGYLDETLTRRQSPEILLEPLVPYYQYAQKIFDLPTTPTILNYQGVPLDIYNQQVSGVDYDIIPEGRYYHVKITHKASGDSIKFLHTTTVRNIEKVSYHYSSGENLLILLAAFHKYKVTRGIEYVEFTIAAEDIEMQSYLLDIGYIPAGYLPGWSEMDSHTEDVIIFALTEIFPSRTHLNLTGEGWELYSIMEEYAASFRTPLIPTPSAVLGALQFLP